MTSVRDWGCLCKNCASTTLSKLVIPSKSASLGLNKRDKFDGPLQDSAPGPSAPLNISKYSKKDLQQILKTILEVKTLAPAPHPFVVPDRPRERPLKAKFPNLYCGKSHLESYNFCHQYEDHFAIAGAKRQNGVLFATIFFQNQVLF